MWAQAGVQVGPIVHHFAELDGLVHLALGSLEEALLEGRGLEDLLVQEMLIMDALHLQACPAIGSRHHVDAVGGTSGKATSVEGTKLLARRVPGVEARRLNGRLIVELKLPADGHLLHVFLRAVRLLTLALAV